MAFACGAIEKSSEKFKRRLFQAAANLKTIQPNPHFWMGATAFPSAVDG